MSDSESNPFHYDTEILKNYVLQPANPYEIWIPESNWGYKYFIFTEYGHIKVDSTYIHFSPSKNLKHECRINPLSAYAGFKLRQLTKKELVEITEGKNFFDHSRSDEHNAFERKLISNIRRYLNPED
ncbi:uncharacterized protein NPIL_532411 [Nephila pilipes]|uniref:Uncharacterized protein n=1 Tax=Nephila pilipes TaxID=299642 RepID=A0A8X6UH38_NEPPI|nr:uncharacterized protein NPIL_532411 [Nephila pilipes]